MGIGAGIRDNIKEVFALKGIMSSRTFDHMIVEDKISGSQKPQTKKDVLNRVGFKDKYDVVYFNSEYFVLLCFALLHCACRTALAAVLLSLLIGSKKC